MAILELTDEHFPLILVIRGSLSMQFSIYALANLVSPAADIYSLLWACLPSCAYRIILLTKSVYHSFVIWERLYPSAFPNYQGLAMELSWYELTEAFASFPFEVAKSVWQTFYGLTLKYRIYDSFLWEVRIRYWDFKVIHKTVWTWEHFINSRQFYSLSFL